MLYECTDIFASIVARDYSHDQQRAGSAAYELLEVVSHTVKIEGTSFDMQMKRVGSSVPSRHFSVGPSG